MKLFKRLFKGEKSGKYESNTLAELNESPDRSKEEIEAPLVTEEKKAPATAKKTEKTTSAKATKKATTAEKDAAPVENAVKNAPKAPSKKSASATTSAKATTEKNAEDSSDTTAKKNVTAPKTVTKGKEKVTKSDTSVENTTNVEVIVSDAKEDNVEVDKQEETTTRGAKTGKFEIKKSKDGRYVFNLYASNNVIVATSQVYSSSTSAMNGIKSVIANASTAPIEDQTLKTYETLTFPKWEIYRDKGDQFRFRLSASNGSCVCHSQGYTSKANCKKGIESIIKFAAGAEITKAYLNKDN